jgi:uncharacterized membrane protein
VRTATKSAPSRIPNLPNVEENIAGLLCWLPLGPVPILASLFFLLTAPYKSNKFVRFHATQSIFTVVALVAVAVGFMIISSIFTLIFPPLDLLMKPLWLVYLLGVIGVFVYMSIKAYSMQSPRLPYVGDMIAKYAHE